MVNTPLSSNILKIREFPNHSFFQRGIKILPHHDSILSPPGFLNFEITPAEKKASDASDGNNLSNSHILACRYTT